MSRRARLVWGCLGVLFGLALVAIGFFVLIDPDTSGHEKSVAFVALVVAPALGLAAGAAPLWLA